MLTAKTIADILELSEKSVSNLARRQGWRQVPAPPASTSRPRGRPSVSYDPTDVIKYLSSCAAQYIVLRTNGKYVIAKMVYQPIAGTERYALNIIRQLGLELEEGQHIPLPASGKLWLADVIDADS